MTDPPTAQPEPLPLVPAAVWWWAGGVLLLQMVLVALYVYPSYALRDSPLFIMVAASGGVAHPPGSPTWSALATLAVRLIPVGDWALRTNLFCGFLGAFTLAGLYVNAYLVIRRVVPAVVPGDARVAALAAPAVLNCSQGWWVQCTTTEQYTLMTALLVVIAGLAWRVERAPRHHGAALFAVLGVLWGLATGNHLSQLALGVFIAALGFVGWQAGGPRMVAVRGVSSALGFCGGISIYAWVYLRSLANPLVDSGNAKTWAQFKWLVSREQWPSRPAEEIPVGFEWEWLRSYDLAGQLSLPGLLLALVGLGLIGARAWPLLALWAALFVPYAAGMLQAHRTQAGMTIDYIDVYGVYDWHVALYLWLALAAAPALAAGFEVLSGRSAKGARAAATGMLVLFACYGALTGYSRSRHNMADPRLQTAALLEPLPPGSLVMLSSDNVGFSVGHELALEERWPGLTPIWASPNFPAFVAKRMDAGTTGTLPATFVRAYLEERGLNPDTSPLRYPVPPLEQLLVMPLITDFSTGGAPASRWLVPRGFLFEFRTEPFTDTEVREAHEQWRRDHAARLPAPQPTANDQDRRGWSEIYERRGLYFLSRRLYDLAIEDFKVAIAWMPERARLYDRLGQMLDYTGELDAAQMAYRRGLALQPHLAGVRLYIAVGEARAGRLREAIALLDEELRYSPKDERIAPLRARMAADLARREAP